MTITLPRELGAVLDEEKNRDVAASRPCDPVLPARPFAIGRPTALGRHHPGAYSTHVAVDVVSGDALPVASIEVTALFVYPSGSFATAQGRSDGNGRAVLHVLHTEPPAWVAIWVGDAPQGLFPAAEELEVVVEL